MYSYQGCKIIKSIYSLVYYLMKTKPYIIDLIWFGSTSEKQDIIIRIRTRKTRLKRSIEDKWLYYSLMINNYVTSNIYL